MLTYVINTSENKTLDGDFLFRLAGYNKIRWMDYGLERLEECAEEICARQLVLGADNFRVALLIDFYGFDRVRSAYGLNGFLPDEKGVDLSLYFPLIEAYLIDHFFAKIRNKELFPQEKHVFYIQDDKNDGFNLLSNEEEQMKYIFTPDEESRKGTTKRLVLKSEAEKAEALEKAESAASGETGEAVSAAAENAERVKSPFELEDPIILEGAFADEEDEKKEEYVEIEENTYSRFRLYCTPDLSLTFSLSDYPYTDREGLSFHEFYTSFKLRESQFYKIVRHHYHASFGSGPTKAAFDNLSLSLYLIKLYEKEDMIHESGDFIVDSLNPMRLQKLLVTSWNKISSARTIALTNSSTYFDIRSLGEVKSDETETGEPKNEKTENAKKENRDKSESAVKARTELKGLKNIKKTYAKIVKIVSETPDGLSKEDMKRLDEMMADYLEKRDEETESSEEYEFKSVRESCKTTRQCPSKNDYENVVKKKEAQIARLLGKTIAVEYIDKDFTEEKKRANKAYRDYTAAQKCLGVSLFGDLLVYLLALVVMIVPYLATKGFGWGTLVLYLSNIALLTGLFALAYAVRILPLLHKMRKAKREMDRCYIDCRVKEEHALFMYKQRYESELIHIESLRYELRSIGKLHHENQVKNSKIEEHRKMLEQVESKLGAMLNNLGVTPTVVKYKHLEDEFDVSRPFRSSYNKIYRIFSLEAIEELFKGKER